MLDSKSKSLEMDISYSKPQLYFLCPYNVDTENKVNINSTNIYSLKVQK